MAARLIRFLPSITRGGNLARCISVGTTVRSNQAELEQAKIRVTQLKQDPGNQAKLQLYGLYKQATVGPCNSVKPSAFDFVGRAKWQAWNSLGTLTQEEAMKQYCEAVDQLVGKEEGKTDDIMMPTTSSDDIIVSDEGGVRTVLLNRPQKKNALKWQMYADIQNSLEAAAVDSRVRVVLLTGSGDYYSSGNDLSNFATIPPEGPAHLAAEGRKTLRDFVSAFVHFPKPLVAGVNGPAVGVMVTTLGLFDLVYTTDNATFHTPFMSLGQSPEGCSSFLFPRIMGLAQSNEMLLTGKKISAEEAFQRGLITRVFAQHEFHEKLQDVVRHIASLPPQSLLKSKALIRSSFTKLLEHANEEECKVLEERWLSEECMTAIMEFMQRKKS